MDDRINIARSLRRDSHGVRTENVSQRLTDSLSGASSANRHAQKIKQCMKRIADCARQQSPILSLANLDLNFLPEELGKLTHLRALSLDGNQLSTIPLHLMELRQLTSLSIANNKLREIPVEIARLTQLGFLNLRHNKLALLPASLGNLIGLQKLDLSHNQFKSLPSIIGHLVNLMQLVISNNDLENLPTEINLLRNLRFLNISHNRFNCIPVEIGALRSLETLDVSNNCVTFLPEALNNLSKLSGLSLVGNSIFFRSKNLSPLFLQHHALSQIPCIEDVVDRSDRDVLSLGPPEKARILFEYAMQKLVQGQAEWGLQNNGLINQLLVYMQTIAPHLGKRLQEAYVALDTIKDIKDFAQAHALYDADEQLIFISRDQSQALIASCNFYYKNILNLSVHDDSTTQWSHFCLLRKNEGSTHFALQVADQIGDLRQIFQAHPLFLHAYEGAHLANKLSVFLDLLNPFYGATMLLDDEQQALNQRYGKYIDDFKNALTVLSYANAERSKRLTAYEDQMALWGMLSKVFVVPQREAMAIDDKIHHAHFQMIMHAFDGSCHDPCSQAMVLMVLSLIFIRYSSSKLFGQDDGEANLSPAALRRYALGLLNKANELDSACIADFESYRSSLINGHCSYVIYGAMKEEMKKRCMEKPALGNIFDGMIPKAWL